MTQLSDFPPDVQAAASAAHAEFASGQCTDNLGVIIARAIVNDRAGRVNTAGLTKRQADCLLFIHAHQRENGGITPSYDEIAAGIGLASKSGVNRLIDELVERGRISRIPARPRAITIISNPN